VLLSLLKNITASTYFVLILRFIPLEGEIRENITRIAYLELYKMTSNQLAKHKVLVVI
jgi:hypothetical protein